LFFQGKGGKGVTVPARQVPSRKRKGNLFVFQGRTGTQWRWLGALPTDRMGRRKREKTVRILGGGGGKVPQYIGRKKRQVDGIVTGKKKKKGKRAEQIYRKRGGESHELSGIGAPTFVRQYKKRGVKFLGGG